MGAGGKFDKVQAAVIAEGSERVEDNRGGSRRGPIFEVRHFK